jgi:hypothetical protein
MGMAGMTGMLSRLSAQTMLNLDVISMWRSVQISGHMYRNIGAMNC